jgi:hypothetical protein
MVITLGLISGIYSGQSPLEVAQQIVSSAISIILIAIYGVIYVVVWPLSLLGIKLEPMQSLGSQGSSQTAPNSNLETSATQIGNVTRPTGESGTFTIPLELIAWLVAGLFVLVVVLVVSRVATRAKKEAKTDSQEERESLGVVTRLIEHVTDWLKQALGRLHAPIAEKSNSSIDQISVNQKPSEWKGSLSVRQIYARLQTWAGRMGYPRLPQQTPIEYLVALSAVMPELADELNDVTKAYIDARYGPLPTSIDTVQSANAAWQRVERAMKKSLTTQGKASTR